MNSGTQPAQRRRTGTRPAVNAAPARPRKPPKKPRRRAVSRTDVQSKLDRFTRLFNAQLKALTKTAAAVKKYSKRVEYYRKRLDEIDQAALAAREEAVRQHQGPRAPGMQSRRIVPDPLGR